MNPSTESTQLRDLLFELTEGGRSKFLIALCDSVQLRTKLQKAIDSELAKVGATAATVRVFKVREDIYRLLKNLSRPKTVVAAHLLGFERMTRAKQHKVFAELNFHRDTISTLGIRIIIWLSHRTLPKMIADAPDLWSRRGAVYHFSQTTTKTFLERLFRRPPSESQKWKPEPVLSEAFRRIFASEKALAKCLKNRNSFSLVKADGLLTQIHAGVDALERECNRGRQIEVALWLWNLSQLDADLQTFLDSLEPDQRVRYEDLYTDRNEALLYLSQRLPKILERYRKSLAANVKEKHWIGLLKMSKDVAMSQLRRMERQLSVSAKMVDIDPEIAGYYGDAAQWTPLPDDAFSQHAVSNLEEWLVGVEKSRPSFLSREEGDLLKLLYANRGRTDLVARLMNRPTEEVRREVEGLERKVSLYLGVSPVVGLRRTPQLH